MFRFEGNAVTAAVGDILITGHFGGTYPTKVVSLGPNTSYNQNIQITASQVDAGAAIPFDIPATTEVASFHYEADNSGGGQIFVLPSLTHDSMIGDLQSDARSAGKFVAYPTASPISESVFRLQFPSGVFGGTQCTLVAAGVVGGIEGGATTRSVLLGYNGAGSVTVRDVGAPTSTSSSPSFFAIQASTSVAGQVTFTVVASPTGPNASELDAQIRCTAGRYSLTRQ